MDKRERIFRYLAACPPAISGQKGHNQTFALACSLYNGFALTEAEVLEYLSMWNPRCQPPWSESELAHKARQAANAQHTKVRGHLLGDAGFTPDDYRCHAFESKPEPPKPVKQVIDPATAIEVYLKGEMRNIADLYEASPVKPSEDYTRDGILLVHHLFRRGELVNFVTDYRMQQGKSGDEKPVPSGYGSTIDRDDLIADWELMGMPSSPCGGWMRMNPMDGKGISDKNVTAFRHILLEFDSIPLDLQISLFARIMLPISAILTSGGKSVHAWVRVDAPDLTSYKDASHMLLKMLERFGLDGANKNPSRLSRLPGVNREIGHKGDARQRLLYLSPNPRQARICP